MFVKAQSKQRFGENKTPYLNVEQIVTIELGHDGNIVAKMSNAEEFVIPADQAKTLLAYVEKNQLR
jgi:hypothetical protein